MKSEIVGAPSFCFVHIDLEPGEMITTESDAMLSMDTEIQIKPKLNGNIITAFLRMIFGGESLFINDISNPSESTKRVTISQPCPGEIKKTTIQTGQRGLILQPGAFLAGGPNIQYSVKWAGIHSAIAREGLFKLQVHGEGDVWYGAFGALIVKPVEGELLVDTAHLVAYQPHLQLKTKLAGGIFSSFFGGEGLVTRVIGKGAVVVQSRSIFGLRDWLNPKLPRN